MSSDGTPQPPNPTGGLADLNWMDGPMRDLLKKSDFFTNYWEDTFRGDLLFDEYPAAKTNGASAAVTFTEHNAQGYLEFVTGTDDDGYAGQGLGLQYTGDRGVLAEFLFSPQSSIATLKIECGLADADSAVGMVSGKSGPTFTGTDLAVFTFDTDHNVDMDLIHAKGGVGAAVIHSDFDLVAGSLYYATVAVIGDNIKASIQGLTGTPSAKFTFQNLVADAGIEGGTALTPWFFVQARTDTASRTVRLHKWAVTTLAW